MSNTVSLFGAVKVDGYNYIQHPSTFYRDANAEYILWVRLINTTINKVKANYFYLAYMNPKGLTQEYFILPIQTNLQNLTDFQAGLLAINDKNTFTLWTSLYKTSNQPHGFLANLGATLLQVLVNDDKADDQYLAAQNLTAVSITTAPNLLSKFIFYLTGDQNYAGSYKYFVKTGNV